MLKSQAPSRLKQVKGRLALPSIKRHKTSTPPLGRSSTQISTETAGTGQLPPSADASAIVQGRWFAPAPVEVSVDRREVGIEPQPQQQQTSCGWQDQRFRNKNKNAFSSTADSSNVRPGNTTAANGSKAAMSCSSAAAPGTSTASPTKHVKTKGQKRVAAAAAAATKASGNVHIEWRVPSPSTNLPYRDTGANSSSHSSRMVRRRAQARSPTAKRLPTQQYDRRNSSSGAPRRSNGSGSSKARSSGSTSRTGLSSSPLKKKESSAVVAPKKGEKDEEAKRKEEGEEGERELPPCPYPGHKNVSWTCRGCGGARHHLTSRSAMEPLQRVHGFKVQRVPNDGDCFFSSIKAALPEATIDRATGLVGGGAATATESGVETTAVAGKELTVAEMREWVAEETGQEQLEFYILQAGANPMDRWLDFVRPLDERIPSDDEEEDEDEDEDEEDSYKDDTASAASSQPQSQSQASQPERATMTSRKSSSRSRIPSRAAATRNWNESGSKMDGGSGWGRTEGRKEKEGSAEGKGRGDTGRMPTSRGGEAYPTVDDAGEEDTVAVMASSASSDRAARRLGRRRSREKALSGFARSTAMPGTNASASKKNRKPKPPSSQLAAAAAAAAASAAAATGSAPRKSARLGRRRRTPDSWRVSNDSGEEEGEGGGENESEEEEEEGKEEEAGSEEEGLPVVQTVEQLRRFVRLEGSIVGHGNCMWADTFAHHVVSRKLKITILFVDMEREKNAWPYRVLAQTATDSDNEEDERFVILKREPSHFVLLKTVPPPEENDGAGACSDGGGGGGVGGGGGASTIQRRRGEGQACFSRSDLPDVVRRLWQIEPAKKVKAPAVTTDEYCPSTCCSCR